MTFKLLVYISSLFIHLTFQFSSVAQSCLNLWGPMDCNMPGFPVHHQLPELAQTHVSQVADDIQPCHPLLSPSSLTSVILHLVFLNFTFIIISNSEKNGKNITKNTDTFFTQIYLLLTFYIYFNTYYHSLSNILTHIHTPEHFWPSFTWSYSVFLSGLSKTKLPMLFLALPTWSLKQGFCSRSISTFFTKILNSGIFHARPHFINTLYINHVSKLHIELCIGTYRYNVDKILKSWVYTDIFDGNLRPQNPFSPFSFHIFYSLV